MTTDTTPATDQFGTVDRFADHIREGCSMSGSLDHDRVDTYALGIIQGILAGDTDAPDLIDWIRNVLDAADRVRAEQAP
jgi:hypothetical protein